MPSVAAPVLRRSGTSRSDTRRTGSLGRRRRRKRPRRPRSLGGATRFLHHLSPGSQTAAPRLHSRVVITHGQQQAAEEPHVGVQSRGRHVPHMVYHAHPARRQRGPAAADRTPESGAEPRIGEGSKMAAALGSFGSRRGSTPEDIGSY